MRNIWSRSRNGVSRFASFGEAGKGNRSPGWGYWKFDGDSIDCEGEFVFLEEDDKCPAEHKRLLEIWEKQQQHVIQNNERRKANLQAGTKLFPETPEKLSPETPEKAVDGRAPTDPGGALHSMVLLGGHKNGFLMLLNWWAGMPLVLVSPKFIAACGPFGVLSAFTAHRN
jgi:hypothetical protein